MRIKTMFKPGDIVNTKCKFTGNIIKKEIAGVFFDKDGVQYVMEHKTMILNAIPEKELLDLKAELEEGVK